MKTLKYFIIIHLCFLSAFPLQAYTQKQGNVWTFVDSCGLDFNNGNSPALFTTAVSNLESHWGEAQASIADSNGVLRFYIEAAILQAPNTLSFDKGKVYNRFNEIIENGTGLRISSTATNGALFLPMPDNDRYSYLFTLAPFQPFYLGASPPPPPDTCCKFGLFYHKIDNYANNNKGKVTEKNKELYSLTYPTYGSVRGFDEKVSAVRHANGRDWWIFIFDRKNCQFVRFLLTPQGILGPQTQPSICEVMDTVMDDRQGEMSFSPRGNYLGFACYTTPNTQRELKLFNFDRCTGLLSNPINLVIPPFPAPHQSLFFVVPYGLAFSPNESKLYVGTPKHIHQFDLNAPDINLSHTIVKACLMVGTSPGMGGGGGFSSLSWPPMGKFISYNRKIIVIYQTLLRSLSTNI